MKLTVFLVGICLCLVTLLASTQVSAQQGIVQIDQVSSLVNPVTIRAGENARFLLRFNNNTGRKVDISNGFRLHSPDGAIWDSTTIDTAGVIVAGENKFALYFDIAFNLGRASCDGRGSDTVGVLGAGNPTRTTRQLPIGYNDTAIAITAWFHGTSAAGKTLCIDTSFVQPGGTWKWVRIEGATEYTFFPEFWGNPGQAYIGGSGYCYQIQPIQPTGQGEIVIASVSNRIHDSMVVAGQPVRWLLRFNNNTGQVIGGFQNAFKIVSPNGAVWDSTTIDSVGYLGTGKSPFASYFDLGNFLQGRNRDGISPDSVIAAGVANLQGLPIGFNDSAIAITAWFHDTLSAWKSICLDTVALYPPAGEWLWINKNTTTRYYPTFSGLPNQLYSSGYGYCLQIMPNYQQPTGQGVVSIDNVSSKVGDFKVAAEQNMRILLRYNNTVGENVDIASGFKLSSPDGAVWDSTTIDTVGYLGTGKSPFVAFFDIAFALFRISNDGMGEDSVGVLGAGSHSKPYKQLPAGYNDAAIAVTAWYPGKSSAGKHICIDTSFLRPGLTWVWVGKSLKEYFPEFVGLPGQPRSNGNLGNRLGSGYCFEIVDVYTSQCRTIRVPADFATIQAAINAAKDCDTILVAPGTYTENISFAGKRILVRSALGPVSTIIAGTGQSAAVVTMTAGEPKGTELNGFTITGGKRGGIYCFGSSPTIWNNTITGNVSETSDDAAGVSIVGTTGAKIAHNRIFGNAAHTYGAAIAVGASSRTNTDDTICYNVMYNNTGLGDVRILGTLNGLMIYNNTIVVTTYDGIALQGTGTINVRNNIVTSAPVWGIYKDNGQINAEYNCLYGNATAFGGGIVPGLGNIYSDPLFVDAANRVYELQQGSPCIDAGDPSLIYRDPDSSRNDIGAFPYYGPLSNEFIHLKQWTRAMGGNDHWYGVLPRSLFWVDAVNAVRRPLANADGLGYLATVTSAQENAFVRDSILAGTHQTSILDEFWLGGREIQGQWTWITGEPFVYTNWGTGEPNNAGVETALGMWGPSAAEPGKFNNSLPDSSVNSLHRFWSVVEWGPAGNDTVPPLINLRKWTQAMGGNNHWYAVMPKLISWDSSRVSAMRIFVDSMPGYLATVTNSAENSFIYDSVLAGVVQNNPNGIDQYYLGGTYTGNNWRWLTNEPFQYTHWAPGEPNNIGGETGMAMYGHQEVSGGFWNNVHATDSAGPVHRTWSLIEWGLQDTLYHDSVPEVRPTNEWILAYCAVPKLDRGLVPPGSIITAHDPAGVLCGATETAADGSFGMMPIYRDDPYTNIDEGCQPGDVISFAINGVPVFAQPPVRWTQNGDQFEVCQFITQKCLEIQLHTGWNLISWNVAHTGDIETLIAPFRDKVDLVLGFDRGALAYDPDLVPFSTLRQVDYSHGYWFKMNGDATLRVCGGNINQFEFIPIYQGWNLVSYWPSDVWTVQSALMTIMVNLQVAVGFDMGSKVFVPGQGPYNTLTSMKPGFGYWIRSLMPDYLDYFFMPTAGANDNSRPVPVSGGNEMASRDWMTLYGKDITLDNNPLAENTSIEVYTAGGVKVGQSTYTNGLLKFMPVYGYDAQDANASQYPKDGDVVTLFVNGVRTEQAIEWHGSGTTLELGSLRTATQLPGQYSLSQNFPNPFNPNTAVSFELPRAEYVTLTIYNMLGQRIRTLAERDYDAGKHSVEWDSRSDNGDAVASGIYLYRIEAGSFVASKKMILLK